MSGNTPESLGTNTADTSVHVQISDFRASLIDRPQIVDDVHKCAFYNVKKSDPELGTMCS